MVVIIYNNLMKESLYVLAFHNKQLGACPSPTSFVKMSVAPCPRVDVARYLLPLNLALEQLSLFVRADTAQFLIRVVKLDS